MLAAFDPLLTATASAPDFLTADARFKTAKATLSGFDWSLGYANPNHDDDAATPFNEPQTVVGPHGDWPRATAALKSVASQLIVPWRVFLTVYMSVPVYSQTANHAFNEQIERFARIIDKLARVWAMHVEVETMSDAAIINGDVAATNGMRTRGFFRTLLQNELIFNNRTSVGKSYRGRYFLRGIVEDLRTLYFTEFVVPLARTEGNGKAWAFQLVQSGVHGRFHATLAEFWMSLDAWAQAAFGFYHPLPDPAKFKPVTPDGSQTEPTDPPVQSSLLPLGMFDAEAGQIAAARAAASGVTAQLDQVLASLRSREGAAI